MPRNGSGVYSLPTVYLATPGTTVRAEQHNSPLQDLAAAMTASLPRDGTAPMLGNLQMNGRRVSNLGAGVSPSDAARVDQVPAFSTWLEALNSTVMAQDRLPYASGPNTVQLATFTAFARDLIFDANAFEARETLGLPPVDQSVWNDGVSTTEAIISPAKLQAKITASQPAAQVVAWVNFNGTGTPAIRASHNVASITDNGTGDYTINFTIPIADANYSINATAGNNSTPGDAIIAMQGGAAPTASAVRILVHRIGTGAFDPAYVFVQIVR